MDRLKGLGSSLVGTAGNMLDKSGLGDRISQLKENYLNKVYDIGSRKFIVKKLIAEGGFGYVFLVREQPAYASSTAPERLYALKRILVQDRERISAIKTEISLMKALAREPHVVRLEDYRMNDSRHELEVLLLMEYCTCSLLDAMNQSRLRSEQDIYSIFMHICDAVARLHANNPPISHRDLKVENVLLGEDGNWKLCDFGSATTATYLPNTERERSVAEEDINRNTTMMYRAPEMVDLYRRQPINEKVDIWALGCVLFKMAYMVDAFDGGLGILNARYSFPEFRKTTTGFEEFIGFMLTSDPTARPNIQQVQERLATLRGVPMKHNPSQTSPTRSTNTNNMLSDSHNKRHSPVPAQKQTAAPAQKQTVADLVDWDGPAVPSPTQARQASQPTPITTTIPQTTTTQPARQPQTHHTVSSISQAPKQSSSPNLLDTLDWRSTPSSTPSSSKPSTSSPTPTPKHPTTHSAPANPHHRSHSASPGHSHVPKSNPPPSNSQDSGPDLLDFSTPLPKPAVPHFTSPPTASPTGFYSPQPPRPNYSLGPPAYYPQYQQTPVQPNRTTLGQDPLAQFTLPKQQSTSGSGLDDFDPLAKSLPPSPLRPSSSPHQPPTSQLAAPPASTRANRTAPSNSNHNHDSLINF